MSNLPVSRFAPSPSGPLHMGSLVAAVAGWLDARASGARWLVRIEDIDPPREPKGADAAILRALEVHGLYWDGEVLRQSTRSAAYQTALDRLDAAGLLFRCRCTRRHLRAHGGVYPGTCRGRGTAGSSEPGPDALRVRVPDTEDEARIVFHDRLQGRLEQDLRAMLGDFILRRRDGLWAYQLAVVVDDAAQGITDVVRGIDLLDSTPRQIYLQRLLGLPEPRYLHLPILVDAQGSKLSKQTGAPGLDCSTPERNLARVLAWLGLPGDARAPVAEQLAEALGGYAPERLPAGPIVLDR